jgi:hypothetical protein
VGKVRNEYKIVVGKPEGKRPHGRRRDRWEDNIRIDLSEICGKACTECIWIRIETSGGLLLTP